MKVNLFLILYIIFCIFESTAIAQKINISAVYGASIPVASFASQNADKAKVIVNYLGRDLLTGYSVKKAGFAKSGKFYELSAEYFKNKILINISTGTQSNPVNMTNFEKLFDEYYINDKSKSKIIHPDYLIKYIYVNLSYVYINNRFSTFLGPIIGYSTAKYPNYRFYNLNTPDPNTYLTHRGPTPNLHSLLLGFKVHQRFNISKNIFTGIDFGLKLSQHKYTYASQGVGLDPITAYTDKLSVKTLNMGIRLGYIF